MRVHGQRGGLEFPGNQISRGIAANPDQGVLRIRSDGPLLAIPVVNTGVPQHAATVRINRIPVGIEPRLTGQKAG